MSDHALYKSITRCLLALTTLACAGFAGAADDGGRQAAPTGFIWGGVFSLGQEIYDDVDSDPILLPIIGYRGENLQVFGPFVSYSLLKHGALTLDAKLSPRFDGYDDSDSDILDGMDEREQSIDVGLGATWERQDWKLEIEGLYDALDRSDGYEWSASLGKTFPAGRFLIEPVLGFSYLDRRHVDYYYGVEADEVTSFRPAYDGDSAVNTTLGLNFVTLAYFGGFTRLGIAYTDYASEITDSPLVDEDSSWGVLLTFSKFFDS